MKTVVIGEIGNNHESTDDIYDSINFLKSRGCLVKLQAFEDGQFSHLNDYVISKELMVEFAPYKDIFYSVFSVGMVDWMENNIDPRRYKLASRSYEDFELIERVKKTGKEIIMSVPYPRDKHAIALNSGAKLLHCVSMYPAPNAQLSNLDEVFCGFSDHTTSTLVPALAVAKGVKIIEKHFKIRPMDTPDSPHSLLPDEWDEMLDRIKEAEHHCY